jgi:poly(A) polymerase
MTTREGLARLSNAAWLHRPETQRVFALLDGAQGRTRAVGGIVRDTLLDRHRETPEIDFASELTPDEVTRRAVAAGVPVYPTGIEHGTVTLRVDDLVAEVTTLREDVETYGRHARVKFGTDWRRDAERRDFTLNALYAGATGELFDPLGGVDDCLAGIVRFIGDADQRIAEDRLRVYRFFRFTASHGHQRFDTAGLAAATRAAGTLGELSAERVGAEMRRMLELPRVATTLATMVGAGVLDLPPALIDQLQAYEERDPAPGFAGRLALMMADGNGAGLKDRWRLSNGEAATAERVLLAARLLADSNLDEAAYRFPGEAGEAVDVAAALAGWDETRLGSAKRRLHAIVVPKFPVSGGDLVKAGMKPGPKLGAELERLERSWIASSFRLSRDELLAALKR